MRTHLRFSFVCVLPRGVSRVKGERTTLFVDDGDGDDDDDDDDDDNNNDDNEDNEEDDDDDDDEDDGNDDDDDDDDDEDEEDNEDGDGHDHWHDTAWGLHGDPLVGLGLPTPQSPTGNDISRDSVEGAPTARLRSVPL
ncbi:hypothetical protein HZH68_013720 [Vespula germanica]|uniref:Uncharacterized protein n=1 Tax=Vespula germanica TaxID=30212 RepID=A0A834MU42_VESGE|nr:hypothetical protein HZH68_013720 [Vespula germanica]